MAYRIRILAGNRGWDITNAEIADQLGIPERSVQSICAYMGWNTKLRGVSQGLGEGHSSGHNGMSIERLTGMIPSHMVREIVGPALNEVTE